MMLIGRDDRYRMGADVERPIVVTTLCYAGSAEERILPDFAKITIPSASMASAGATAVPCSGAAAGGGGGGSGEDAVTPTPTAKRRAPPSDRGGFLVRSGARLDVQESWHADPVSRIDGGDFVPADRFGGARRGYVFGRGGKGLGYYRDPTQRPPTARAL